MVIPAPIKYGLSACSSTVCQNMIPKPPRKLIGRAITGHIASHISTRCCQSGGSTEAGWLKFGSSLPVKTTAFGPCVRLTTHIFTIPFATLGRLKVVEPSPTPFWVPITRKSCAYF